MTAHAFFPEIAGSVVALVACSAFQLWTARRNHFFFFARTLPADAAISPAAESITRQYSQRVLIGSAASIVLLIALCLSTSISKFAAFILSLLFEVIAANVAFAAAHRAAGIAFSSVDTRARSNDADGMSAQISVPLLAGKSIPGLRVIFSPVLGAAALYGAAAACASGHLKDFADKAGANGGAVLLGMGSGLLFAATAVLLLLRYSARHRTAMARYTARNCMMLGWLGALVIAGTAWAGTLHQVISKTFAHGVMLGIFVFALLHIVYAWTRLKEFVPAAIEQNGDHLWHWGLFYYNATDPALFVQNRNGPGYTLNFGNFFSWPIAAAVVGDFAFIFFARHHL
jgi:hypothetical protein